jgi:phage terminase large subunit-like protein
MPSRQSLTQRLNFCMWVDSANPFIAPEVWTANGKAPSESPDGDCVGALDLSNKNDLSALVLTDEAGSVYPYFFTPKEGLRQREERDRAPYSQWVREGSLIAVPGKTIDYRYIAQKVGALQHEGFQIQSIAFDPWNIDAMIAAFEAEGVDVTLIPHGQGYRDMSKSIQALEDALLDERLRHGNHPVLTWCMNNAQVETDPAGNRKFTKRKATGRIDGAVALAMAAGAAAVAPVSEPQFFVLGGV